MPIGFGGSTAFDYAKGHQDTYSNPWGAQQPFLIGGFERAKQLLGQPALGPLQDEAIGRSADVSRNFNPGQYDYLSNSGLNAANRAYGGARVNLGMGSNTLKFLGDPNILSPDSNPFLARYAAALSRPVIQNLTERILPSIRSGAIDAGQYGSSRQGIAEGIASRGATDSIADATAGLYSGAYGQGLDAMKSAAGLAPAYASANTNIGNQYQDIWKNAPTVGTTSFNLQRMPADLLNQVGTQEQQAPWDQLMQYMNMVRGNYGSEGRTNSYGQDLKQTAYGSFGIGGGGGGQ